MVLASNIFTFFGFFFLLLIHRRKVDNFFALEQYSEDGLEGQGSPEVKPIPQAWGILELICFLLGIFLRCAAWK